MKKKVLLAGLAMIILILGFLNYREIKTRDTITKNNFFDEAANDLMRSEKNINNPSEQASIVPSDNSQSEQAAVAQTDQISAISGKIAITEPAEDAAFFVGDTLRIQLQLPIDNLVGFMLSFQGQTIFDLPKDNDPAYKFILSGGYIENQDIVIIALYKVGEETKRETVSRRILITPREEIISFKSLQETVVIEKGKTRHLNYQAAFPTAISSIGETDLVQVKINDPQILSYDSTTGYFTGLEEGSTIVEISYRGKTAYASFNVLVYREPPVD